MKLIPALVLVFATSAFAQQPAPTPAPAASCLAVTSAGDHQYEVIDVINYLGARIGQKYDMKELQTVEIRDGVLILVLTKGYTPEDVALARNLCQPGAKNILVVVGATPPKPEDTAAPAQATNTPTTDTKATMFVYRLSRPEDYSGKPPVYIDERQVTRMENGGFFIVKFDYVPGLHTIRSDEGMQGIVLYMRPGQVYYIRVDTKRGPFGDRSGVTFVEPEEGRDEIGQTKLRNAEDIRDHELVVVGAMPSKPAAVPSPAGELGVPAGSAPGTCRSVTVTSKFCWTCPSHYQYTVLDVVNYSGARIGQKGDMTELADWQNRYGVHILVLTKGYTPQDVALAHNFCQLGAKEPEPKEMVEGTVADAVLQRDIAKKIQTMETADHPGCKFQIVKQLHSADKPGVERWEVKSCDATSSYDVLMVPSPQGGVDFRVKKSVVEQEKKTETAAQPPVSSRAGAADALPEGFVLYEGQKSQFTIALPKGWVAYDQSQMVPGKGNSQFNLILFYLPPNPTSQDSMSVELLTKIGTGEIPSFFVQKLRAENGMSCAGFSEKAEKNVIKLVTDDAMFGKGATILEAPRSEPIPVAGCKGIRIRGTGKPARETSPQTSDVYAVSDGKGLYLFTLRGTADNYKKNVEVFQKSVATARLTAAK